MVLSVHHSLLLRPKSANLTHSVEFVIQILKKVVKLASEAEARRREAWARAQDQY
jgi:hypothetical protein